jgi:hypothetical protein
MTDMQIMREITPLSPEDCFYVVDRRKTAFDYPVHCHPEYELNFIEHAAGACRVVGDSMESIGDYELVLVAGADLEHGWEQGSCTSTAIREITIQWDAAWLSDALLQKNQFRSIRQMLEHGSRGLCFPLPAIMRVYSKLEQLASGRNGFQAVLDFLCMNEDRHYGNLSYVLDKQGNLVGIQPLTTTPPSASSTRRRRT